MRLVIIGAGGHGQVVFSMVKTLKKYLTIDGKYNLLFLDDRYKQVKDLKQTYGTNTYSILGMCSDFVNYIDENTEFYPAFGDNKVRLEWEQKIEQAGGKLASIIHPTAYIADSVIIKEGTVVLPYAIINTGCIIGKACIINVGAIVEHGCVINDACHINSGAIVMAENCVPKYTKVDSGEVIGVRKWNVME